MQQSIAITNKAWKGMYYSDDIDVTKVGYTPISATITSDSLFVGNIAIEIELYDDDVKAKTGKAYLNFMADVSQTVDISYRVVYVKNTCVQIEEKQWYLYYSLYF